MGLGSMGGGMALQALEKGHEVVGSSRSEKPELAGAGVEVVGSSKEVAEALSLPRVVLLNLPAGEATGKMVTELGKILEPGDVVVDGANSHWEDSKRRHAELADRGVHFLDAGVSGGVEGARRGACLMDGGEEAFRIVEAPLRGSLGGGRVLPGGVFRGGALREADP